MHVLAVSISRLDGTLHSAASEAGGEIGAGEEGAAGGDLAYAE